MRRPNPFKRKKKKPAFGAKKSPPEKRVEKQKRTSIVKAQEMLLASLKEEGLPYSARALSIFIFSSDFAKIRGRANYTELLPRIADFARKISRHEKRISPDYRVSFSYRFKYEGREKQHFTGLHLVLQNNEGQHIGVVSFRLGYPIKITNVQGAAGDLRHLPGKFFRETGIPFERILLDELIRTVNSTLKPKKGTNLSEDPVVRFSRSCLFGEKMSPALRRRILSRYLPKENSRAGSPEQSRGKLALTAQTLSRISGKTEPNIKPHSPKPGKRKKTSFQDSGKKFI